MQQCSTRPRVHSWYLDGDDGGKVNDGMYSPLPVYIHACITTPLSTSLQPMGWARMLLMLLTRRAEGGRVGFLRLLLVWVIYPILWQQVALLAMQISMNMTGDCMALGTWERPSRVAAAARQVGGLGHDGADDQSAMWHPRMSMSS